VYYFINFAPKSSKCFKVYGNAGINIKIVNHRILAYEAKTQSGYKDKRYL